MSLPQNKKNVAKFKSSKTLADFQPRYFPPAIFSRLNDYFQKIITRALLPLGLILPEWRVLICLSKKSPRIVTEIVTYVRLPQPTVSRALARLQAKGLVTRIWNEKDNRVAEISLTKAGHECGEAAVQAVTEAANQALGQMNYARIEEFLEMATELLTSIEKDKPLVP